MEGTEQNYEERLISPPPTPDPFDPKWGVKPILFAGEYLKKILRRARANKWFVPTLAVLAFFLGYWLFARIAHLEGAIINWAVPGMGVPDDRDLFLMALIEQVVLGATVFIFFALSRTYQLTLFVYAGFLTYHIHLITQRMLQEDSLRFLLTPVFIYAFTGLLVTLGLMFNKKLAVFFLILNVFLLTQHNVQTLTGHDLDIRQVLRPAEPRTASLNDEPREKLATTQGTTKGSFLWCHNFENGLRYGDYVQEVSALQEALRRLGYTINDTDGEFRESTEIAVKRFQSEQRLLETGTLESDTRDALNKRYSCGAASKYGVAVGSEDATVSSVTTPSSPFSGIARGYILNFYISEPPLAVKFISKDYEAGRPNGSEYPSPNYSFATNYSIGDRAALQYAACDPSAIADMAVLLGKERITRIACKEIQNGYIGYVAYRNFQSPTISLYALAALYIGSTSFPTVYADATLDDATLNEQLSPEEYMQKITKAFSQSDSPIKISATAFEAFVNSVRAIP